MKFRVVKIEIIINLDSTNAPVRSLLGASVVDCRLCAMLPTGDATLGRQGKMGEN